MLRQDSKSNRLKVCVFVNVDWFILSHFTDYLAKIVAQNFDLTVLTLNTGRCDEIRSMGVRVIEIDLHRGYSNIFFECMTLMRVFSTIRKISPDVLELVTVKPVIYLSLIHI